jgi:hypothetical protein
MTTKKSQKIPKKYYCENCDYTTSSKKDYNKHLMTRKHKLQQNTTDLSQKSPLEENLFICECGKSYTYRGSLFNHKKKCELINTVITIDESKEKNEKGPDYNNLICKLLQDNKEMRDLLKDQQDQHNKELKTLLPKIGNNNTTNNNTQFNINVFLNEECKNAINLSDFIAQLSIEIKDLVSIAENGFIDGIGQTICQGLKQLSIYERPIHCTDKKRDTLYIKESDNWSKDTTEHELMKNAIQKLKKRNMKEISTLLTNNEEQDEFNEEDLAMKIIHNHVKGSHEDQEKSLNKIIKNVSKEVLIDKTKINEDKEKK